MTSYSWEKSKPIPGGKNKGKCVYYVLRDGVRIASSKPLTFEGAKPLQKIIDSGNVAKIEAWLSTLEGIRA